MKIIVGLGNPGKEFENTRHNAGFVVLEALRTRMIKFQNPNFKQIPNSKFKFSKRFEAEVGEIGEVMLVKPQSFMNSSGEAVRKLVSFYKMDLDDVWVVHDDLDIELGKFTIVKGRGPKVHNGVNSVEEKLGSGDFWRVRIGVDDRHQQISSTNIQSPNNLQTENSNDQKRGPRIPGEKYVLMKMTEEETEKLRKVAGVVVEELVERLMA